MVEVKRLAVGRDAKSISLVQEPLACAHGASGWTFPSTRGGGQGGAVLGRWVARGDVVRADVELVRSDGDPGGVRWDREELREQWTRGSLVLAPWVAPFAFGEGLTAVQDWHVAPGVRMLPTRVPTLPPATHTNAFLVGESEFVLIEPAPVDPREQALLMQWVGHAVERGARPIAVLVTHHHPDHIGATAIADELGLPLWAHAATAARIDTRVDRALEDGEVLELGGMQLQIVHTPGHAEGHLCFVEPRSRTVIVGDMIAGTGSILVESNDGDMQQYLDSLERLRALGASKLLPAHGGVIATPELALSHYIEHRLMREQKVVNALARGAATVTDLVPRVYHDAPTAVWGLAAMALRAHLDKLEAEGRAQQDEGIWSACQTSR